MGEGEWEEVKAREFHYRTIRLKREPIDWPLNGYGWMRWLGEEEKENFHCGRRSKTGKGSCAIRKGKQKTKEMSRGIWGLRVTCRILKRFSFSISWWHDLKLLPCCLYRRWWYCVLNRKYQRRVYMGRQFKSLVQIKQKEIYKEKKRECSLLDRNPPTCGPSERERRQQRRANGERKTIFLLI